jgi:hypothetical protein
LPANCGECICASVCTPFCGCSGGCYMRVLDRPQHAAPLPLFSHVSWLNAFGVSTGKWAIWSAALQRLQSWASHRCSVGCLHGCLLGHSAAGATTCNCPHATACRVLDALWLKQQYGHLACPGDHPIPGCWPVNQGTREDSQPPQRHPADALPHRG